jgi:xanthine dehydrogenase accessory factor
MIKGDLVQQVQQLRDDRVPFVHATVVRTAKPTSVRPGDSALVLADGTIVGFVGGVCAQASVRLHAARVLETGEAVLLRLVPGDSARDDEGTAPDGVVVVNNPCLSGGSLDIFLEPQLPTPRVAIAGDTPIARALEGVARAAGYDVVRGHPGDVEPRSTDAAMIVASHGSDEEVALIGALEAGVGYVALVASGARGAAVLASLDVPEALRAEVHTPAGLDIGARTPADIAIAILAQLIAVRTAGLAGRKPQRSQRPPATTAIDPVCGMEVAVSDATVRLDLGGERVYFCCEGCRSTYAARRAGDATAR